MKLSGEKIKKVRELRGFTQEEMAQKLNISPQAYGKIERNETKLDLDRLKQIAAALEVDTEFITNFDEKQIFLNSQIGNKGKVNYHHNDNVSTVLEAQIKQQQEEIAFLRKQVEELQTQNTKLLDILSSK